MDVWFSSQVKLKSIQEGFDTDHDEMYCSGLVIKVIFFLQYLSSTSQIFSFAPLPFLCIIECFHANGMYYSSLLLQKFIFTMMPVIDVYLFLHFQKYAFFD